MSVNICWSYGYESWLPKRPVSCKVLSCWRLDIWQAETVVGRSRYDSRPHWPGLSTTCVSPIDAVCDWTLIVCAGVLSRRLSWLLHVPTVTVGHSGGAGFGVIAVNILTSVNKMMQTSLDEYFSATVLNGRVLHGRSLHSSLAHCNFWAQNFTGSLVTITALSEIYYKDWRWNNCENQLAFGKVTGKSKVAPFSGHGYIVAY